MAEYIERTEELILAVNAGARAIENTKRYHGSSYCLNVFSNVHKEIPYLKTAEVLRGFDEIPSADVAPVRHGRWEQIKEWATKAKYRCSICGREIMSGTKVNIDKYPYCHCGARMDLEEAQKGGDE